MRALVMNLSTVIIFCKLVLSFCFFQLYSFAISQRKKTDLLVSGNFCLKVGQIDVCFIL